MKIVKIMPMPRELLNATVTVKKPGISGYFNDETAETTELRYVRVQKTGRYKTDSKGVQNGVRAELYYDCENSLPRNFTFTQDMIVEYENERYSIVTLDTVLGKDKIHHYKLDLV